MVTLSYGFEFMVGFAIGCLFCVGILLLYVEYELEKDFKHNTHNR